MVMERGYEVGLEELEYGMARKVREKDLHGESRVYHCSKGVGGMAWICSFAWSGAERRFHFRSTGCISRDVL